MASSTSRLPQAHETTPQRRNYVQHVNLDFNEGEDSDQIESMDIADAEDSNQTRFSLGVSECIETKTTTITTRTTRKFPQVFSRNPLPLKLLDAKEYPLATKPTPRELTNISYSMLADEDKIGTAALSVEEHVQEQERQALTAGSRNKRHTSVIPIQEPFSGAEAKNDRYLSTSVSPSDSHRKSEHQRETSSSSHTGFAAPKPRPLSSAGLFDVSRRLRKTVAQRAPPHELAGPSHLAAGFLATPDASELTEPDFLSRSNGSRKTPMGFEINTQPADVPSTSHPNGLCAAASPGDSDTQTIYSSTVATPPITDADQQPFADEEFSEHLIQAASRPVINVAAIQDASLPSPRLSPTIAATQSETLTEEEDDEDGDEKTGTFRHRSNLSSQRVLDFGGDVDFKFKPSWDEDKLPSSSKGRPNSLRGHFQNDGSVFVDTKNLLDVFDSMKTEMKSYMMYQFLRRCPRPTLRVVADAVNPALKCDFLLQLPLELGYLVLSYLDCQDLCRAAQTSRHWRNMIDRNETGWKDLFDKEGFTLAPGELEKSIIQGWGWQDPVGAMGYEQDLSRYSRLTQSDAELTRIAIPSNDSIAARRQPKRKRNALTVSDRSKRRASAVDGYSGIRDARQFQEHKQHKSEGPLSAANAAILAVPDPGLGLASLRQLHLYKTLYRRHHMIRRNWTSGEVKPKHVAFAAHPRHVITCLQFDDDKIITGSDDTLIHIYDTKTGKLRKKLEGHEGGVWALQYEGNILVSGSTDRSVRVWDIERGLCQQVFYGHTSTVRCLQILMPTEVHDGDGRRLMRPEKPLIITGSRDSQLRVWRLPEVGSRRYIQTGPPAHESDCPYFIRTLQGHGHSVRAIAAHGDTLVSGSYDSTVRVWKISTGDVMHVLSGHSQKVYSIVLDIERNRCISGSMDSMVKIWDLGTGACLYTLEGHSLLVGLLDLRDDRLVSAAADSTLRIWDPENGRCRNTLIAHTGAITCFQHDAQKVISGSEKMVKMWDVKTGECIQDLLTELSGMWQVKFDERRCIAAVQRDALTYVEILDFGAVRDGEPVENLGKRILLNEPEVRAIIEEEV